MARAIKRKCKCKNCHHVTNHTRKAQRIHLAGDNRFLIKGPEDENIR